MKAATYSAEVIQLVESLPGKHVLVVGDVMLDRYLWGRVDRISPEAPVPVVEVERESFCLGGAANVAHNIAALGGSPPSGARSLNNFAGRAIAMNVIAAGTRRSRRVAWSVVADSDDWTGLGSGFAELDSDQYPIEASAIVGGRLIAFKGDATGGSIWVGTPTGAFQDPIRWDPLQVSDKDNIGILIPRSLVVINPGLAFFLGHDSMYLYDGARSLLPVGHGVANDITSRVNQNALRAGFAWYKHHTREIHLALPMGDADYPTEVWIFNVTDRRVYGPYSYPNTFTAAASWVETTTVDWDTYGANLAWTDSLDKWDTAGGSSSERVIIMGDLLGASYLDNNTATTDDGNTISATWTSPAVTPARRAVIDPVRRAQKLLAPDDTMVLREVNIQFKAEIAWRPNVEVSTDGLTWTRIDDDVEIGDSSGRILSRTYNTAIPGVWFQFRVSNATGAHMALWAVEAEWTYGGSDKHAS